MGILSSVSGWIWNIPAVRRALWYPGHHYSPYPSLRDVKMRHDALFRHPPAVPGVVLSAEQQCNFLHELISIYGGGTPSFPERATSGYRYYFSNPFYSYLDGMILHLMLRKVMPRRVIEVGSGHSSAMILDTAERCLREPCLLTCVDPFPTRLLRQLRHDDRMHCRVISGSVQDVPMGEFEALEEGDILFIDSSHVMKTGSDVEWVFRSILPVLKRGVWIHFHDIYYPFEYLPSQVFSGYAYNEAYCLRSFLQFNEAFKIKLFSSYLWRCFPESYAAFPAELRQAEPCAIWIQRERD